MKNRIFLVARVSPSLTAGRFFPAANEKLVSYEISYIECNTLLVKCSMVVIFYFDIMCNCGISKTAYRWMNTARIDHLNRKIYFGTIHKKRHPGVGKSYPKVVRNALSTLQWRVNQRDDVSNLWRLPCLPTRLFRRTKKASSSASLASVWGIHRPVRAHLHLRRIYTTSEISVRASESELGRNRNNWIDVSCLHWSESVSETFASDVRVRARRYV